MVWLHLAKVSQVELQHHLNVEEWYLPTASCISPVWAPDRSQIKCHCSHAGKALKQLFHSMEGIGIKTNNKTDDIFHEKIEVSVPVLSQCSPWQQEMKLFLVYLIFLPPILAVCSKSHYQPRCNYHRKKQLCVGTKNFSAKNRTVKSVLPMFCSHFLICGPFPCSSGLYGHATWSGHVVSEGHWCLEPFPRRTMKFMVIVLYQSKTHLGSFICLLTHFMPCKLGSKPVACSQWWQCNTTGIHSCIIMRFFSFSFVCHPTQTLLIHCSR